MTDNPFKLTVKDVLNAELIQQYCNRGFLSDYEFVFGFNYDLASYGTKIVINFSKDFGEGFIKSKIKCRLSEDGFPFKLLFE